jgi:hypothetical protein
MTMLVNCLKRRHNMFTVAHKLRIILAIGIVGAALGASGVASAASAVQKPGTGTPVVATQPPIVAQYIDPSKVGSAGVPGYDDAECESLANSHNQDENDALNAARNGDSLAAKGAADLAAELQTQLENNCFIMD